MIYRSTLNPYFSHACDPHCSCPEQRLKFNDNCSCFCCHAHKEAPVPLRGHGRSNPLLSPTQTTMCRQVFLLTLEKVQRLPWQAGKNIGKMNCEHSDCSWLSLLAAPGALWTGAGGIGGGCAGGDELGQIICCQLKRQQGSWTSLFSKKCFPPRGTGCYGTIIKLWRAGPRQSAPVRALQRCSLTCQATANRKPRPLWFHISGCALAVRSLCLSSFQSLFCCLLCPHSVRHTTALGPNWLLFLVHVNPGQHVADLWSDHSFGSLWKFQS